MQAAESMGGKLITEISLPATVLYQLAAPSTPEPIREEFMREADTAGGVTTELIVQLLSLVDHSERQAKMGDGWINNMLELIFSVI